MAPECSQALPEVHAVCMSILSMLSSAQEKVRPKDRRSEREETVTMEENEKNTEKNNYDGAVGF